MALSLGVSVGDKIKIGPSSTLEVLDIQPGGNVSIAVGANKFHICSVERTEILPEVFVCYGESHRGNRAHGGNRLAFEAPDHISIRRCQ